MNWRGSRVLVVVPHVDDEVHCAGTIHQMRRDGAEVALVSFSFCEKSLTEGYDLEDIIFEFEASMDVLGIPEELRWERDFPVRRFPEYRQKILDQLVRAKKDFAPTIVLCPSSTDTHQDHRVVYEECERLFRTCIVLGYLHPLNMREIHADLFVRLSSADMATKLRAWHCYMSQRTKGGPFNTAWIDYLCRVWSFMGRRCGGHAEAFEFIGGSVG